MLKAKSNWWGENRIDYVLYAPEKIANLPKKSLPYIFHACFWESTDVAAFIAHVLFKSERSFQAAANEGGGAKRGDGQFFFRSGEQNLAVNSATANSNSQREPVEKWQRRLNRVKLRVISQK